MKHLRVALCQLNTKVGDLEGNVDRALEALAEATEAGADVAVFGEMTITGYPVEDLVLKPGFVTDNLAALDRFAAGVGDTAAVIGYVDRERGRRNAAAVCVDGAIAGRYFKRVLPNYAVFDEERYFTPGSGHQQLFSFGGIPAGVVICEDSWVPAGPIIDQVSGGAEIVLVLNASPFRTEKIAEREEMIATRARDAGCPIIYVNAVGGQDELVFDGGSFVVDADGEVVARAKQFVEQTLIFDVNLRPVANSPIRDVRWKPQPERLEVIDVTSATAPKPPLPETPMIAGRLAPLAELYEALVLGTRDYLHKNGFSDVVIGLSGGIDSSIVALIAADALGGEHTHGVSMPSRHSSDHSRSDAELLAENLGMDFRTIAIEPAHSAFIDMLAPSFEGRELGLTEENLQSRIRGVTLMALSNEFGWMVLTTGNKSESAVGYSTLYGDTAGGFAVIKDVPKTVVYDLVRYRNEVEGRELVPEHVLTKPPSAELRPDQVDEDSLPPYDVLDAILAHYVDEDATRSELIEMGFDAQVVHDIARLVDLAEYKRRQTPPGIRVSQKAFGRDRRLPITNAYRG